jgi:hypothetical protein
MMEALAAFPSLEASSCMTFSLLFLVSGCESIGDVIALLICTLSCRFVGVVGRLVGCDGRVVYLVGVPFIQVGRCCQLL